MINKEIELVRECNHPNIIKIFEYFVEGRFYYNFLERKFFFNKKK